MDVRFNKRGMKIYILKKQKIMIKAVRFLSLHRHSGARQNPVKPTDSFIAP